MIIFIRGNTISVKINIQAIRRLRMPLSEESNRLIFNVEIGEIPANQRALEMRAFHRQIREIRYETGNMGLNIKARKTVRTGKDS
jgi:hypothetical protein